MTERATDFWPGWAGILELAAVLAVIVIAALVGAALSGRRGCRGADLLTAWAVVAFLAVSAGTLLAVPIGWAAVGALALAGLRVALGRSLPATPGGIGFVEAMVLSAPFLLAIATASLAHWDDFQQWHINALFLVRFDRFPESLAESPSSAPAYPYGMALWSYFASRIAGSFVENAGALVNATLLIGFGCMAVGHLGLLHREQAPIRRWAAAAFAVLLVIPLNPSFHRAAVVSGLADSATAVAVGTAGLLLWRFLESWRNRSWPDVRATAVQLAAALVVTASLKQANLVLCGLLTAAGLLLCLRDGGLGRRWLAAAGLLLASLPAVMLAAIWQAYTATVLQGGQKSLGVWHLDWLPSVLDAAWQHHVAENLHYFIPMALVSGFALRGFLRNKTALDRLLVITATVFVGYSLFLILCYLTGVFTEAEAMRAASFWRYSTHVGLLGLATVAIGLHRGLVRLRVPTPSGRSSLALAGLLVAGVPIAFVVAGDYLVRSRALTERAAASAIAATVPAGSRIGLIDPKGYGYFETILRYQLWRDGDHARIAVSFRDTGGIDDPLRAITANPNIDHLVTVGWDPRTIDSSAAFTGIGNVSLFRRVDAGWRRVRLQDSAP